MVFWSMQQVYVKESFRLVNLITAHDLANLTQHMSIATSLK